MNRAFQRYDTQGVLDKGSMRKGLLDNGFTFYSDVNSHLHQKTRVSAFGEKGETYIPPRRYEAVTIIVSRTKKSRKTREKREKAEILLYSRRTI